LVDYPFGCVEQTASRMLPLALALQSLSAAQQPLAPMLTQRLAGARLSLAQMAGPQAAFGWWGRGMPDDAFLTAYAYYADWRATQALRTSLPESHWQRVLDVYAKSGSKQPALQRALALHWMQEMGLTVASMQGALLDELAPTSADAVRAASAPTAAASASGSASASAPAPAPAPASAANPALRAAAPLPNPRNSWVMADDAISNSNSNSTGTGTGTGSTARDMALVLAAHGAGSRANAAHKAAAESASARLADINAPLPQALLLLTQKGSADKARALLAQVRGEHATLDRAQALLWIHKALGGRPELRVEADALAAPWLATRSSTGDAVWQWPANTALPKSMAPANNSKAQWAYVAYESRESVDAPALPVRIERQLFKVVSLPKPKSAEAAAAAASGAKAVNKNKQAAPTPPDDGRLLVKLELVKPGTALDSNALYLDQLNIQSEGPLRWALVEAALPPGAAVESGTWGLDLPGTEPGQTKALERASHQNTAQGYAVPVDALAAQGTLTVRHLVRFAQRGQYKLPPTRLYRMYEPDAKAVDRSGQWATMEVR
jgi:alpha-2-macroglobulin